MRSVNIKAITIATIMLLCSSISGYSQELFRTTITLQESSVSISPNGLLAVYTAQFNAYGIVVWRTSDWSVQSRIGHVDELGGMENLSCHGFVNDTIIAANSGPGILLCNVNSGTVVDTLDDLYFETFLSHDEVLVVRVNSEVKDCYAYNIHSQTTRFLFQTFKYDKVVSTPSSPYIVVDRNSNEKPIIYRKTDSKLIGQIDCSTELRYEHPFSFSEDGMFVYCLADPSSICKYSLENGAQVRKIKLPQMATGYVDVYVNRDESLIAYLVETSDLGNTQDLFIVDPNGNVVQKVSEEEGSLFYHFVWQRHGSKFYFGTTAFLRERDARDPTYSRLLAITSSRPKVYSTCDGNGAIVVSEGIGPIQVDITHRIASIMNEAPPYEWLTFLTASRLKGTDLVHLLGINLSNVSNPCTIPWYNDPTSRVDEDMDLASQRCYSKDGQWVVGTTISDSVIIVRNRHNKHELRISNIDQDYYSSGISIAETAGLAFVVADTSVLKINMIDGEKELFTDLNGPGRKFYLENLLDSKVDTYGRTFVFFPSLAPIILCRSFPDDAVYIELADTVRRNKFLAVDLSNDGSRISLIEQTGLVRILDTKTLKETHRMYLDGFRGGVSSGLSSIYVNYDIESRILISVNFFGELVIQRWPEEPVSVNNGQEVAEQQVPGTRKKMLLPSSDNVTIHVPITDPIVSVACYNVLGMDQSGDMDITTSGSQVEVVNRTAVAGPIFVVVKTTRDLYTYTVVF